MADAQPSEKIPAPAQKLAELRVVDNQESKPKQRTAQESRRFWTKVSIVPCIIIPVFLAIIYYMVIAADRYAVESKFAIRSPSGPVATDILGMMSGVSGSGSTITDSYIVIDFLKSRELVEKIATRLDILKTYDHENADFIARLDPSSTKEEIVKYLSSMISTYFDTSSQIITLEVQAFTPEDAKLVSAMVLQLCEELVNQISEKAREDTVRSAQREVDRAEDRLRQHRKSIATFREERQDVDPKNSVTSQYTLLAGVQERLNVAKAKMSTLREFLKADAPQVRVLKSEIAALEAQVVQEKARLGTGDQNGDIDAGTLTSRIGEYEGLSVDLEFLQRAYVSALASLERARAEADRQQRYLAAFVHPSIPQEAIYPERYLNIFIVLVLSVMIWGILLMSVYIVREHAT